MDFTDATCYQTSEAETTAQNVSVYQLSEDNSFQLSGENSFHLSVQNSYQLSEENSYQLSEENSYQLSEENSLEISRLNEGYNAEIQQIAVVPSPNSHDFSVFEFADDTPPPVQVAYIDQDELNITVHDEEKSYQSSLLLSSEIPSSGSSTESLPYDNDEFIQPMFTSTPVKKPTRILQKAGMIDSLVSLFQDRYLKYIS